MEDLTVLFLTPQLVPPTWADYHRSVLINAVGDAEIITISRHPLSWGKNLIQESYGITNFYKQILRGAKEAKTKYIAMAEDDTLYSKEHFQLRPPPGMIGYDMSKWCLLTWGKPTYYHKIRITNATLIAERDMIIDILEERFAQDPNSDKGEIGYDRRSSVLHLYAGIPSIQLHHAFGLDVTAKHRTKRMSPIKAYDIPYWGKADELVAHFK
jgi:hypothetical protein